VAVEVYPAAASDRHDLLTLPPATGTDRKDSVALCAHRYIPQMRDFSRY
jgi:hypothetical protein